MRTRLSSHSEVCHVFAARQQEYGAASRVFFEGDVLYSYGRHFPMAAFSNKGSNVVYFTTRGYSSSTSKHLSYARSALSHFDIIYCYDPFSAREGNHSKNLEDFENRAKYPAQKLVRARKPEIYLSEIASIRAEFEAYVEHFKIAKKYYKKFVYLFIQSKEGGTEATEKERKAIEREKRRREKQARIDNAAEIEEFMNFERARIYTRIGIDYLRYNPTNEMIETSQAVRIDKSEAERLYKWVLRTIEQGGCTGCNEIVDGMYKVSSVSKEFFTVGCHTIPMSEVYRVGKQLFG